MKTIITHFYNEEFLLPWWLNHHKHIFDHGILIDYASTDRSRAIIKEICPNWIVLNSKERDFGAEACDRQVTEIERNLKGWRIALNVTEFIVGNTNKLMSTTGICQYLLPSYKFYDWNPTGTLDKNLPLWNQLSRAISYKTNFHARRARSLHNFNDIIYDTGRHWDTYNCEDAVIFHFANCISCPEMLNRRLQIQYKVPVTDLLRNYGWQHTNKFLFRSFIPWLSGQSISNSFLDAESLKKEFDLDASQITDISKDISKYTNIG